MDHPLPSLASEVAGLIRARPEQVSLGAFHDLAARLLAAQRSLNPAYAAWCAASRARPSHGIDADGGYPAVPTEAFKQAAFSCIPAGSHTTEFRSSGTTAHVPSRHLHHDGSLALYKASAMAGFERHVMQGVGHGTARSNGATPLLLSLTPPLHEAPHSSLVHMLHWAVQLHGGPGSVFVGTRCHDGTWETHADAALNAISEACSSLRPVVLMGTAFNLVHLLDDLARRNLRVSLPPGSRIMETGGYKGRSRELSRSDLHAMASVALDLPVTSLITEYGMTELGSQAYDRPAGPEPHDPQHRPGILHFPHWARATVLSPETGREVADGASGIVEVLDLANVWSVAKIRTSDLAIRRGTGFELLGRAPAAEPRGCSRMNP